MSGPFHWPRDDRPTIWNHLDVPCTIRDIVDRHAREFARKMAKAQEAAMMTLMRYGSAEIHVTPGDARCMPPNSVVSKQKEKPMRKFYVNDTPKPVRRQMRMVDTAQGATVQVKHPTVGWFNVGHFSDDGRFIRTMHHNWLTSVDLQANPITGKVVIE